MSACSDHVVFSPWADGFYCQSLRIEQVGEASVERQLCDIAGLSTENPAQRDGKRRSRGQPGVNDRLGSQDFNDVDGGTQWSPGIESQVLGPDTDRHRGALLQSAVTGRQSKIGVGALERDGWALGGA